jgi:hypothetical protein
VAFGLSDAERAFVDDAAESAVAGDAAKAWEGLMAFADWLADQDRGGEFSCHESAARRRRDRAGCGFLPQG